MYEHVKTGCKHIPPSEQPLQFQSEYIWTNHVHIYIYIYTHTHTYIYQHFEAILLFYHFFCTQWLDMQLLVTARPLGLMELSTFIWNITHNQMSSQAPAAVSSHCVAHMKAALYNLSNNTSHSRRLQLTHILWLDSWWFHGRNHRVIWPQCPNKLRL